MKTLTKVLIGAGVLGGAYLLWERHQMQTFVQTMNAATAPGGAFSPQASPTAGYNPGDVVIIDGYHLQPLDALGGATPGVKYKLKLDQVEHGTMATNLAGLVTEAAIGGKDPMVGTRAMTQVQYVEGRA